MTTVTCGEFATRSLGIPNPSAPADLPRQAGDTPVAEPQPVLPADKVITFRLGMGTLRGTLSRAAVVALLDGPADRRTIANRSGIVGREQIDNLSASLYSLRKAGYVASDRSCGTIIWSLTTRGIAAAQEIAPHRPFVAPPPKAISLAHGETASTMPTYRDLAVEAFLAYLAALRSRDTQLNRLMLALEYTAAEQGETILLRIG